MRRSCARHANGTRTSAVTGGGLSVDESDASLLANGLRHSEAQSGVNHDDGGYAHLAVVPRVSGLCPAAWQQLLTTSHDAAPSAAGRAGLRP